MNNSMFVPDEHKNSVLFRRINAVIAVLDMWVEDIDLFDEEALTKHVQELSTMIILAGHSGAYESERMIWKAATEQYNYLSGNNSLIMTTMQVKDLLLKFKWAVSAKYN